MIRVFGFALSGLAFSLLFLPARADQLSDGIAALRSGDNSRAFGIFKSLADQGNPAAENELGLMFVGGIGVAQDFPESVKWFSLSAAQGNINAEGNLGEAYRAGRGVQPDYPKALELLTHAATNGDHAAQFGLAMMFARGQGVAQSTKRGYVWFSLSAEGGNPLAVKNRDVARAGMDAKDLEGANQMLAQCKRTHLTVCG